MCLVRTLKIRDNYLAKIPAKVRRDFEGFCAAELTLTVWCGSSGFQCGSLRFNVSKNCKKCLKMLKLAKIVLNLAKF